MFKILMDESLIDRIQSLTKQNNALEKSLADCKNDLEVDYIKRVDSLRESMQKALTESDIEREKFKAKLEVYEKFMVRFNFNNEIKS